MAAVNTNKIVVKLDSDLEDIIPGYLENRRKDLIVLRQAKLDGDFDVPRILGHRMKGSGAGYGFEEITGFGREIENGAKENNWGPIEGAMTAMEDYLDRLDMVFE